MSPELSAKFDAYENLLRKWSKTINLVAPSTLADIRKRHILDSLQLEKHIPNDTKILLDIGSGAGFPGIVLAMAKPDVTVNLVESDERKCSFLRTVSRETFTPVVVHTARVENVDNISPDVITARALASLSSLLAMTEKWWKDNPAITLILPKGENWQTEVSEAQKTYQFSLQNHPSATDGSAAILVIRDIHHIK